MRIRSELLWLAGCCVAATAFCWLAPEYGYSPVPFFTAVFYLVTGFVRVLLRWLKSSN
jgi:hypothetical protein